MGLTRYYVNFTHGGDMYIWARTFSEAAMHAERLESASIVSMTIAGTQIKFSSDWIYK